MKFYVYAGDKAVGWSDLPNADPPMGVVSGSFHPNDEYKEIQVVIREHHLYDGCLGRIDEDKLKQARQKIHTLGLKVKSEEGELLEPVGGIHITDFSEELDEEPYQLDVLGLPREQFLKYWREADEQYTKQWA